MLCNNTNTSGSGTLDNRISAEWAKQLVDDAAIMQIMKTQIQDTNTSTNTNTYTNTNTNISIIQILLAAERWLIGLVWNG